MLRYEIFFSVTGYIRKETSVLKLLQSEMSLYKSPDKYSHEDDVLILAVTVKHHATVGTARIWAGKVLAGILIGNNDVIHIVHRI